MALSLMGAKSSASSGRPAREDPYNDAAILRPRPLDDDRTNILIVDDRPDKLLALQAVLEELGQNIIVAQSGAEALKCMLEYDFAVILLDVNMPGMDGLETASFIRKRQKTAHTPIIFVTAYADEMHTARGYSLGAVDYILAPVVPDVLRSKVRVFVQLHRMTQQMQRQAAERVALAREQAARAAAEESIERFSFLARLSEVLDQSLDLKVRTKAFARLGVPFLADMVGLVLVDDRGRVRQTDLAWPNPWQPSEPSHAELDSILSAPYAQVIQRVLTDGRAEALGLLESGEPTLIVRKHDRPDPESLTIGFVAGAAAACPLRARGRTQGVMLLAFKAGRRFDASDFSFCNDVAGRVAVLLDNALLYERVRDADGRKDEFLAMLGHELRNPMAPIRYAVHILRKPNVEQPKRAWGLDVIERQVGQLSRLVDDLLDVSRITRGKIELKLKPVALEKVVSTAVETCQPLIESLKHHLTIRVAPEPLWVHGDHARLTQVVANLLTNAAKYTEPGGRIALEVDREGTEARIRVRDSGIGILPENIDKIFELFAQVDRKVDRAQGGLGIGLTLVQRLIRLHGGSIEVFSAGSGKGAEFVVRLPSVAAGPAEQERDSATVATPSAGAMSVLVVDDNVDSAQTMVASLRLEGFTAEVAFDGEAAIRLAAAIRPDVVLLDIGLPGMSGFEVAHALRALSATKDALLVALSGYGQADDRQRSREAGMDHHLTKPVDPAALHSLFASLRIARDRSLPE